MPGQPAAVPVPAPLLPGIAGPPQLAGTGMTAPLTASLAAPPVVPAPAPLTAGVAQAPLMAAAPLPLTAGVAQAPLMAAAPLPPLAASAPAPLTVAPEVAPVVAEPQLALTPESYKVASSTPVGDPGAAGPGLLIILATITVGSVAAGHIGLLQNRRTVTRADMARR